MNLTRPDVPAALQAVLERMMAKQPEHRPASFAEVIGALAPWTDRSAKRAPVPVRAPASRRMPRWLPWALLAGLALVAAGLAALAWL